MANWPGQRTKFSLMESRIIMNSQLHQLQLLGGVQRLSLWLADEDEGGPVVGAGVGLVVVAGGDLGRG